jgi:hypothetical protein
VYPRVSRDSDGGGVGDFDAFLAHYDDGGRLVWAEAVGGPAQESASDLAVAPDGSLVMTGIFGVLASPGRGISTPTISTFGSGDSAVTLTAVGTVDSFVARFDSTGQLLWAKREGGSPVEPANDIGRVTANAVAAFPDGSSVNVGAASGEVVFGEHEPHQIASDLSGEQQYAARLAP